MGLLPPTSKKLIDAFLASRKLPDPMTSEFANAVQEALSGLEKIAVKGASGVRSINSTCAGSKAGALVSSRST